MTKGKTRTGKAFRSGSVVTFQWSFAELGEKKLYQGKVDDFFAGTWDALSDGKEYVGIWAINSEGQKRRFRVHRNDVLDRISW